MSGHTRHGFIRRHASNFVSRENMKELPNTSIDYYILPNRIICSMVGMWPIEEKSSTCSKIFAYIRLILALTAINSVFVPEIMMIVSSWGDISILAGKPQ